MTAEHASFDARRMEALAQIAAGIAPPLSDLLTVIRGQAGLLLNADQSEGGAQAPLSQIYVAAEKASSLLRQLLIFSEQQTMQAEPLDLNGRIAATAGVLGRLHGDAIAIEFQLALELPLIMADADMIEQVLLILVQNARDAMPAGGRLALSTAVVDAAEDPAATGSPRPPERAVLLQVEDNGPGVDPEILGRIFEPFFTTKTKGRNLGLGLATVFGIMRQHRGWVTMERAAGKGTRCKLFFPLAPVDAVLPTNHGATAGSAAGKETILLVEDDAAVRDFVVTLLQEEGYRVLQASSGADALEAWKWHGARVRLLLTDMVLDDHLNGMELAARLRADNPAIGVICTSGHCRETMKRFPELSGGYRFLQKPCRPDTLLAAVRSVLASLLPAPSAALVDAPAPWSPAAPPPTNPDLS